MKDQQYIENAYKFFEKKLTEKLGENHDGDFGDFEMEQQRLSFIETQKEFPLVTEDDLDNYQETHNWT